jgi:YbbR domain-containing protein
MREVLWRALTADLPLKIAALAVSIGLFAIVRGDKDAATGVFVRIVYTLPSDRVLVSEPVSEVKVGIRGPWTRIQRLDDRDIEPIRIDLSHTRDSVLHFSESMVSVPAGLRVVSISPTETKLDFEPRAERELAVHPVLEGQPQEGFRVTAITVEPDRVRIAGPKRVLQRLERLTTRPLRIADATGAVRETVALDLPVHAQFLDAGTVTVNVDIRPAIVERAVEGVPVRVVGLTHLDGELDPKVATVILRGPSDLVRRVAPTALQLSVDARLEDSHPPALFKKTINVAGLPSGVAAEVRPDSTVLATRRRRE